MTLFSPPKNVVSPNTTKGLITLAKHWNEKPRFFKKFGWQNHHVRENRKRLRGDNKEILLEYNAEAYEKLMQQNQLIW